MFRRLMIYFGFWYDEPTERENRIAYFARVDAGQKLAEYMPDVDYTRPMGR